MLSHIPKSFTMKKFTSYILLASTLLLQNNIYAQTNNNARSVPFGGLQARSIGPAVMSGRVSDVEGVNSKPEIVYVGAANGGVWKSINAGASFRPIFDDYPQSIGTICVDQAHPDTVWVGTGEVWVRNSVSIGTGIYVSKNGGSSWEFKGLPKSERIGNIIVDPRDSKTLYVAVQGALWSDSEERGVYKSTDFGATWQKILYVNPKTGCADLTIDPKNPDVLYASMWEHRRRPDFFHSGGEGSALYKTTDGGKNWQKIHNGLPSGMLGRMGIAVAPSNSNTLYLSVEAEKDKGFYKSTDAGASWKLINKDFSMNVRPFYFSRIVVDPTDENKMCKAGFLGSISETGGKTWRQLPQYVHADAHDYWYNPKNPNYIICGTDGGAYRSYDGGQSWSFCTDLPISQFYMVSVDDDTPYNIYGGLQDNNCWVAPSNGGAGVRNSFWEKTWGGDGFYSYRHPKDKNIIFAESQGGELIRYDKRTGQRKSIKPAAPKGEPEYRFNWNSPVALSPSNPERMYFGCQYLLVTDDKGETWRKISPDLTTNDKNRQNLKSGGLSPDWSGAETNTTIVTIAESPKDGNIIWCGTDDGNVQVTTNGGKQWTEVGANIPNLPKGLWVSHVEPSSYDKNTCFVVVEGHRSGDMKPYIFKTTDLGKTWIPLSTTDLDAYALCIRQDLKNPDVLYLGTEFGFFISIDGGLSWRRFTNNLPKTGIPYMAIQPRDNALIIASHGRGVFILDDLTPIQSLTKAVTDKDFHLFTPKPAIVKFEKFNLGGDANDAGAYAGEGFSEAVIKIIYYQKKRHSIGDFKVELLDNQGKMVKETSGSKSAGISVVTLPLFQKIPKLAPTTNVEALGRGMIPPRLPDGNYTIRIRKDKDTFSAPITLKTESAVYSEAERKEQRDALMRCLNINERLAHVFAQLKTMEGMSKTNDEALNKKINAFTEGVKNYRVTLASTEGDGYVASDELVRERFSILYFGFAFYPGRPSANQMEKLKEYEAEMTTIQTKFDTFVQEMKTLNAELEKAGKKGVVLKTFEDFKNEK